MISTGAFAQSNLTFDDWDEDDDMLIEKEEFIDVFTSEYVNDWNTEDDDHLDDEDFKNVTFRMIDVDDDNQLSAEEWTFGYEHYFQSYLLHDKMTVYDKDANELISYNEFRDAIDSTDYYVKVDVDHDSFLSQFELAEAVFNNWDTDDSSTITAKEYAYFDSYYLDF